MSPSGPEPPRGEPLATNDPLPTREPGDVEERLDPSTEAEGRVAPKPGGEEPGREEPAPADAARVTEIVELAQSIAREKAELQEADPAATAPGSGAPATTGRLARARRFAGSVRAAPRRAAHWIRHAIPWRHVAMSVALGALVLASLSRASLLPQPPGGSPDSAAGSAFGSSASRSAKPLAASPARSGSPAPRVSASAGIDGSGSQAVASGSIPPAQAPIASVSFVDLVLDSASRPDAMPRTITFDSDGPGPVSVVVVESAPTYSTRLCLAVDDQAQQCATGATPGFASAVARSAHSHWTVSAISSNQLSPTIELAIEWPTNSPLITLVNDRFAGLPNPDSTRSMTVQFVCRRSGQAKLTAEWGPALDASLSTSQVDGQTLTTLGTESYQAATSVDASDDVVTGRTYQLTLRNDTSTSDQPLLTASLSFP